MVAFLHVLACRSRFARCLQGLTVSLLLICESTGFLLPGRLTCHPSSLKGRSLLSSCTSLGMWNLVNMIFPEGGEVIIEVDPNEILASFELMNFTDLSDLTKSHNSLTNYLQLWGRNLELHPEKGLTTPITATDFRDTTYSYSFLDGSNSMSSTSRIEEEENDSTTDDRVYPRRIEIPRNVSMTLKFRPPKRYLSYKEQKNMERGVLPDRKGAKVDAWSPGGIQLLVHVVPQVAAQEETSLSSSEEEELLVLSSSLSSWRLLLEARRCDIDGDTVIKYSSERAIVRRLKEAVRIWLKVRGLA